MLGEMLGGISCVYDLWAHMIEGIGRASEGISCVYGQWAHKSRNASQYLPIPLKLSGLEIHSNSFSVVIFFNRGYHSNF